jgi:hypothetical protein
VRQPFRQALCLELTCHREATGGKEMVLGISKEIRYLKGFMKPILKDWLTTGLGEHSSRIIPKGYSRTNKYFQLLQTSKSYGKRIFPR